MNLIEWLQAMVELPETLSRIERTLNSMAKKDEILAAIAAEREQYLAKIEEVLNSKPDISDATATEIVAAVRGIVPDTAPTDGKKNVSLGFISDGDEYFSVQLNNRNVSAERAALLKGIHDGAVLAGNSQASGGTIFKTSVFFDDGERSSETYTNGKQKAAYDVFVLSALLQEAQAQLNG